MMPLNQQIELGLYISIMLKILLGYTLGALAACTRLGLSPQWKFGCGK